MAEGPDHKQGRAAHQEEEEVCSHSVLVVLRFPVALISDRAVSPDVSANPPFSGNLFHKDHNQRA